MACACCKGKDYQERLRYHAERFSSKGSCAAVLQRYEDRLELVEEEELMRLTFHVASWVWADANMAALQLLLRFVKRLKHHCCTWPCKELLRLLKLLSGRAKEKLETPWLQLSMLLEEILPCPGSGMPSKGLRRLQKAIQRWRNCGASQEEQANYVLRLETAFADQSLAPHLIFRKAVAALSPPRSLGLEALEGFNAADAGLGGKDLQFRLRKLVLQCLDRVNLSDEEIQAPLEMLTSLLSKFEDMMIKDVLVGSKKHWLRLQEKCCLRPGCAVPEPASASGAKKRLTARCPHGVKRNCLECTRCPHDKVRRFCPRCVGGCPHGRLKWRCAVCTGCQHGKLKQNCAQCNSCVHGYRKHDCSLCFPCPHGKLKRNCRDCSTCPHGKLRRKCVLCRRPKRLTANANPCQSKRSR